jgi:hypothetical protein
MKEIPEDMKAFVKPKEQMTKEDYRVLGQYLMRKKIESIKSKFRRLFRHEKG